MNNNYLRTKKIAIALHEGVRVGPSHDLKKFLLDNSADTVLFIAHPLTYLEDYYKECSRYEFYQKGELVKNKTAFHWRLPDIFLYCKDFTYTILWCLERNERYDLFIGVDPLNALSGLVLKKLGRVEKVVYYSIDYYTPRFSNKILNNVYHLIDKTCVKFSDETWNLSMTMSQARERYNNMDTKTYNKQQVVPIGVWFHDLKRKTLQEINKKKIIYIGSLIPHMGVDLILKAMPEIIKKIPDVELEIVGGGKMSNSLKELAEKLDISKNIKFYGWVQERRNLEQILSDGAIGLAPFNTAILNDEIKNADPAKMKDYMAFGMPVIVTDAISNTKELEKAKCIVVINNTPSSLAKNVVRLLRNETLLKEYRENALRYVEQFDYARIYSKNLNRIFEIK